MSWNEHHLASEKFAIQAELAAKKRDHNLAIELYRKAAEEEAIAISQVEPDKTKTLAVTVTSAASLWFKAEDFRRAEQLACQWLASDEIPLFASEQLQVVLQSVWNERTMRESGIKFSGGEVLVRVAGGEIVHGGAPLDLISLKVDEIRNLFYRTIELLLNRPLRRRGMPSPDIQERFRPWLLQAPAGSYQFAVRVQKPLQLLLYPVQEPEAEEVSKKVLEIIEGASQERTDVLVQRVPSEEYREVFLKLTRNLAPTGKTFKTLEIRSVSDVDARPIVLTPDARQTVNTTIRASKKRDSKSEETTDEFTGTLRALHLDRDWIEIALPDGQHVQVLQTGDVIDDIIGPLVNHKVVVEVTVQPDGKRIFRDIQPYE
jgi:hypothetical protein